MIKAGDSDPSGLDHICVGVNVFANRDILAGEEIHNCYFSEGSEDLSKVQRREKLAHYMFTCECHMCLEEESVESDGDSDSGHDSLL